MSYINSYHINSAHMISYHIWYHIIYPAIHHTICHVTYVISCHITYSVVPLQRGQFYQKYSQKTPHGSPVKARYGVSFVDSASDWYHVSVPAIFNAKSFYIGPRFNGTRLYNAISYISYTIHHIYIIAYTTSISKSYIICYIKPCITSYMIYVIYHWPLKELVIWSTKAVWICHPHRNWIGVINALRRKDSAWSTLTK